MSNSNSGSRIAYTGRVARELQDAGAIDYSRGQVTVLNRAELDSRSCECYWVIREEFDRLVPTAG